MGAEATERDCSALLCSGWTRTNRQKNTRAAQERTQGDVELLGYVKTWSKSGMR